MIGTNTLTKRVVFVVATLVVAFAAVMRADRRESAPPRTTFATFPMQLGNWRGIEQPPLAPDVLAVLGVTDYITRVYVSPDQKAVGLYSGYWNSQRQGDTIHSPLNCLPGAGWEPVQHSIMTLPDPRAAGSSITVNRVLIQKGLDRQLVLYWYQSHDRIVASEYWGKVYLVSDAVLLNRTDGALVRVTARVNGDGPDAIPSAETVAVDFVKTLLPALHGYLPS
jgi:EpsI family protein